MFSMLGKIRIRPAQATLFSRGLSVAMPPIGLALSPYAPIVESPTCLTAYGNPREQLRCGCPDIVCANGWAWYHSNLLYKMSILFHQTQTGLRSLRSHHLSAIHNIYRGWTHFDPYNWCLATQPAHWSHLGTSQVNIWSHLGTSQVNIWSHLGTSQVNIPCSFHVHSEQLMPAPFRTVIQHKTVTAS